MNKTQVTTKITVTIGDKSFEMTVAEAKALKAQLEAAIPENPENPRPIMVPCPYPVPEPRPWRERYPVRPQYPEPIWKQEKDFRDFDRMYREQPVFPPMTICNLPG